MAEATSTALQDLSQLQVATTTANTTANSTVDPSDKRIVRVAAGMIIDGEQFLIARRAGARHLAGKWEFPGGKIEHGESPVFACKREILEELGCEIAVDSFFLNCHYEYEDFILSMDLYLCHLLPGQSPHCSEHSEIKFITADAIDSIDFAPADIQFLPNIKKLMASLSHTPWN